MQILTNKIEKKPLKNLKKVGLEDKFNYEPNKLSGGQKQKE